MQTRHLWLSGIIAAMLLTACAEPKEDPSNMSDTSEKATDSEWVVDFFDDFETFNEDNWQDQRIWVNNEDHCYVPDGQHGTREVSDGTLKVRVVDLGEKMVCDNLDKHGKQHPPTQYVAGRVVTKNKHEFVKGKWTARLRVHDNGQKSMFPAWWILGARNNESPVQEADENICWPLTGSGEIDIFEHHGDYHADKFTTGAIKSLGECDKGDWMSHRTSLPMTIGEYHEYSVEWEGSDLVYRVDGEEVYRNEGEGDLYPEPMFAILNFAKITDSPMTVKEWVMEVDWVKHERRAKDEGHSVISPEDFQSGIAQKLRIEGEPVVRSTLKERMEHFGIPGVSIAYMKDGQVLWTHTEGVINETSKQPVSGDTLFQAASISKPTFAMVLMRYRQQHGLDLDANVNELLKSWQLPEHEWQGTQDVTLRRLLSHSAGTTVHGFPGYASDKAVPTLIQLLEGKEPTNTDAVVVDIEPGSTTRYSGGGTSLAQLVLADVSGKSLTELSAEEVFEPLKMTRSYFTQPLDEALRSNAATPYRKAGEPVEGGAHTYTALAAAGLWTTPNDLLKLAWAVHEAANGERTDWLDKESAVMMLTPQSDGFGIGFGVNEEQQTFGHGGANEGFRTNLHFERNTNEGLAIMTNSDTGGALVNELMILAGERFGWSGPEAMVKTRYAITDDELGKLTGEYHVKRMNNLAVSVSAKDGHLVVHVPPYLDNAPYYAESPLKFFSMNGDVMEVELDDKDQVVALVFDGNARAERKEAD